MTKNIWRSAQSRAATSFGKLCKTWLEHACGSSKQELDVDVHLQEAYETITELQSVWRDWVFGEETSRSALRRITQANFFIDERLWDHPELSVAARWLTALYGENLKFVGALARSLHNLGEEDPSPEERQRVFRGNLAFMSNSMDIFDFPIPRFGDTTPDNLDKPSKYNYRWDGLPELQLGTLKL